MASRKIGRYEIKTELGRGGMATVFHAHDPRFRRDVALKVLPRHFLHDPTFRTRFEREAQTIASLEHSAIVPVYDFGEEDGQLYLVMRFLSGGSLTGRLEKGALPLNEVVRIITQIAPALDEAHRQGIIHRDLKPDNILFDQRQDPFITDFGIAKLTQGDTALTVDHAVIGTPGYMSPEQVNGKAVNEQSDIYALGVIVFQMLAGKLPYEAETSVGLMMQHIIEPAPNILTIKPDLPPGCATVITQAMAKEPVNRYLTAAALAEALTRVQSVSPTVSQDLESLPFSAAHNAPTISKTEEITSSKDAAPEEENLQTLLRKLASPQTQHIAIGQLTQLGDEALKALVETLLKGRNLQARSGSAKALGQICQDPTLQLATKTGITKILIRALADPEPEVRYSTAEVLGKFEGQFSKLAIKPLTALLKDKDEKVRRQAQQSLQEIKGEPIEPLIADPTAIRLKIGLNERQLELTLNKVLHFGRLDPEGGVFPEVDLTNDQGLDKGISRRHARIMKRDGIVVIEDLGSTNGTFINGKRLLPYTTETLQHNDQLHLGNLAIKVEFVA